MEERNQWIFHIKRLREYHGIGLVEAERLALADPVWRRWAEGRINADEASAVWPFATCAYTVTRR